MFTKRAKMRRKIWIIAIASMLVAVFGFTLNAQEATAEATSEAVVTSAASGDEAAAVEVAVDAPADPNSVQAQLDTTWVVIAAILVFFMQTGFAMLESGLIRQRAVVNALLENFMDACVTAILFWAVGFGVAFGASAGGFIGTSNFFLADAVTVATDGAISYTMFNDTLTVLVFFFFQFAFAATAATIATGAMAERTDFIGDIIYTGVLAMFSYPIVVHWVWGGGWLGEMGFLDFAGSTVVHTVGGITALVGAWMLGPRANREFGKFPPAHNLGLATLGTMILWFGWYGFNAGSTVAMSDTGLVALVLVNTTLAAAAGALTTMFLVFFRTGKWDLTFTLNGSLAGLVGITAGCAFVMPWASVVIGFIAGLLVYFSVEAIEAVKIDDPVGAFSVHGACGIWGTVAIGLFGDSALGAAGLLTGGGIEQLGVQALGSGVVVGFTFLTAFLTFSALKAIGRLRVEAVSDKIGIDAYEHGVSVWPDVLPMPSLTYKESGD